MTDRQLAWIKKHDWYISHHEINGVTRVVCWDTDGIHTNERTFESFMKLYIWAGS